MKIKPILILLTLLASILGSPTTILAQAKKPNILVIWGDDIGLAERQLLQHWHDGLSKRLTSTASARKVLRFLPTGMGEQICTAGRSAFLTGQAHHPHRTEQGRFPGRADMG